MYRINWKSGVPYVEHGEEVISGKKRKISRIKWPSEEKLSDFGTGRKTLKEAFEKDILETCSIFGENLFSKRKPEPWQVVSCISKINRLYNKLKKIKGLNL